MWKDESLTIFPRFPPPSWDTFLARAQGLFQKERRTFEGPREPRGVGQLCERENAEKEPPVGDGVRSTIICEGRSIPPSGLNRAIPSSAGFAWLLGEGRVGIFGAFGDPFTKHCSDA